MRVLFVSLLVFTLACGDDTTSPDASIRADVGVRDGDAFDVGPDLSIPDRDAGPDAPLPEGTVQGMVRYERRVISAGGLAAPSPVPFAGIEVALVVADEEVERTTTNEMGAYRFTTVPTGAALVRVGAMTLDPAVSVTDFRGNQYAYETDVLTGATDLLVRDTDFGGAMAILNTMRDGLVFAATAFDRPDAFPAVTVFWERGRTTPGGTSYAAGDELWILGGPDDTDEYDTPVLLHELGHYLQWVYGFYDVVGGNFHNGADTDPRLAWGEGWASFFSAAARDSGFYGDTIGDELAISLDVGSFPETGEYVANPGAGMDQNLSEWLITASLFELYTTGDPILQRQRSFSAITGWTGDRSLFGHDFVDFLDGYLCGSDGEQDALVQEVVVVRRRFPYDLAPSCSKPGDRPGLRRFLRAPEPVVLPGELFIDRYGRRLRLIRLTNQTT